MGKKIRVTYEASPWRNGPRLSNRRWAPSATAAEAVDAPAMRMVHWHVWLPSQRTAIASGSVPFGDNKTLARIKAKQAADEALRAAAGGMRR